MYKQAASYLSTALVLVLWSVPAGAVCLPSCNGAGVPCTAMSVVPSVILGTGTSSAGSIISYQVVVKDANGLPLPNVLVTLDFSGAIGPTHGNTGQGAGTAVSCAAATLTTLTDTNGDAIFHPRFEGYDESPDVQVSAANVCLGSAAARSVDFVTDPHARVGLPEYGAVVQSYLQASFVWNLHFSGDNNNRTDLADLAVFSEAYLGAADGAYCVVW